MNSTARRATTESRHDNAITLSAYSSPWLGNTRMQIDSAESAFAVPDLWRLSRLTIINDDKESLFTPFLPDGWYQTSFHSSIES